MSTTYKAETNVTGSPVQVTPEEARELEQVGVVVDSQERSGTYILNDDHSQCSPIVVGGLELLPIAYALKKYDWLSEYFWQLVSPDKDEITREIAAQPEPQGFFLRVRKGSKITMPFQAALHMTSPDSTQAVHNLVIVEEDGELNFITGCVSGHHVHRGLHLAVTETFVGRSATVTNSMVHNWGPGIKVRPRAATLVEENGTFVSNYVSLEPAGDIQMDPLTILKGDNATARFYTVILGSADSLIDTGGTILLQGKNTSAEVVQRAVSVGGHMIQRGLIVGENASKGHVDCSGMLMGKAEAGSIKAVPGIESKHADAQLSHEASIGKIAQEQISYLQAHGMDEAEAVSMILRGFLTQGVVGLGEDLDARIRDITDLALQAEG